jgi:hypothetical protein
MLNIRKLIIGINFKMNTQLGDFIMADKKDKSKTVDKNKKKDPVKSSPPKSSPKKK